MTRTIPELPLDIIFSIFEELDRLGETQALKFCAKTCALWDSAVQKILSADAIVLDNSDPDSEDQAGWTEWHGQLMTASANPSSIARVLIEDGAFFDFNWLSAALTALPNLRQLRVIVSSLPSFPCDLSPPHPLGVRLELFEICTLAWRSQVNLRAGVFALAQCLSEVKTIVIRRAAIDLPWDYSVIHDIGPTSVFIDGLRSDFFYHWFKLLSPPRASQSVRHLRLSFYAFEDVPRAKCADLLRKLKNLETIDFDFVTSLHEGRYALVELSEQLIEEEFAPVLTESASIHTFCMRLPESGRWSNSWPICLAMLKAMPAKLRHLQLCVEGFHKKVINFEAIAAHLGSYSELRTVEVVFEENKVIAADAETIAEYRELLRKAFPDFASRDGGLRLTSELRPRAWFSHD